MSELWVWMGLTGAFLTCVCSICSGGYACGQGKEGCTGSDCRPAVEEVGQGQDFHHLPPPQDPQACSQAQVPPQVGSPRQQARPIPDHQVRASPFLLYFCCVPPSLRPGGAQAVVERVCSCLREEWYGAPDVGYSSRIENGWCPKSVRYFGIFTTEQTRFVRGRLKFYVWGFD